jgi:ectoine hydroxylase-related dioxygenase (phytanoyl-CoA dioxygenase family)
VNDLSRHHETVSDFLSLTAPAETPVLTESEVQEFHSKGFLTGFPLLKDSEVERLRSELAEILAGGSDPRWYEFHRNESDNPDLVLLHALGAWRIAPGFHDLLWHPRFVSASEQLLGGPVRFWHDQLFCKPAGHGGAVSWHQDYSYWSRTVPMSHLTCWIALDDATPESGVIQFIPGSHKWDLLPITGLAGDMDAIRRELTDEQWAALSEPECISMKKGECSFHHPLTVHGSSANRSDHPRRATVINVISDGVRSASTEPLLSGVPVTPPGKRLEGQFFPLLSKSS